MVNAHLKTMGYTWEYVFILIMRRHHLTMMIMFTLLLRQLHPNLQKDIRGIINGPDNVALIPGRINGGVRFS
jgi:hypothetical protein